MTGSRGWTRRRVLTASGAVAAAGATAGPAAAQDTDEDFEGWFGGEVKGAATSNYDGSVTDMTGQDEVTVDVGAEGNGGPFAFGPAAMRIDPGTTVTFEWISDTHNIVVETQPDGADWQGVSSIENTGFSITHTFETEGTYKYYCQPPLSIGMKGAIVVGGGAGGGAPVGEPDYEGWFGGDVKGGATDNYTGSTVDSRGQDEVTVEVGAEGNGGTFAFGPAAVRISPGTTVNFEWTSDTHNIVVESQPGGGGWGGISEIRNTGFSTSHTFEATGIYKYYCQPHLSVGMKGAIVVGDVGPSQAGPSIELTGLEQSLLALGIGAGVLAPVGFALADKFVRSWGVEPAPARDAPAYEPAEPVGHDEFEPGGTWRLVLVYFAILVVMWVFMYFVEFLGRGGPTVIG